MSSVEKTILQRINELEARVKTLEDLAAEVTRVFLGAPKEIAKPEVQPTANEVVILSKFPEHLAQHLHVESNGRIIRNDFVSRDFWMEMNDVAKGMGYKWWVDPSNSKNNHWEKQ